MEEQDYTGQEYTGTVTLVYTESRYAFIRPDEVIRPAKGAEGVILNWKYLAQDWGKLQKGQRVGFTVRVSSRGLLQAGIAWLIKRHGTVKWYRDERGFGFIETDEGDIYLPRRVVRRDLGHTVLTRGQRVGCEVKIEMGKPKGSKPAATSIWLE